jgi:two-component system chemotaxis response regulator CheB
MVLEVGRIRLNRGPKVHHTRPSADPLFMSAAQAYGEAVLGIVRSGGDSDGAAGLWAIKRHGGVALVQDPAGAANPSMPYAAISADHPDGCLSVQEITRRVAAICTDGA